MGLNVIVHGGKPFIENKGTFKKPGLRGMFDFLVSKKGVLSQLTRFFNGERATSTSKQVDDYPICNSAFRVANQFVRPGEPCCAFSYATRVRREVANQKL